MVFRLLLVSFSILLSNICFAQEQEQFGGISYPDALNLVAKQMMLSQRMTKSIVLEKLGGSGSNIDQELSASKTLFERNLAILKVNARNQNDDIKGGLKILSDEWKVYKDAISRPVSSITVFLNTSEKLLIACRGVMIATRKSALEEGQKFAYYMGFQPRIRAISKVGVIRMLSQKMCINYAACRLSKLERGLKSTCDKYRFDFNQMDAKVKELLVFKINNDQTDQHLASVLYSLQKLEENKLKFDNNEIPILNIIKISNELLRYSSALAKAYSTPPKRLH